MTDRADAKRQIIADQQWQMVQEEDKQNCELIELSRQILELTQAVHQFMSGRDEPLTPSRSGLSTVPATHRSVHRIYGRLDDGGDGLRM